MIHVVIDTREKRPWAFPPHLVRAEMGTLRTGDYALKGDMQFAIERKSLDDFLGTISSGWERFLREIGRMEGSGFCAKVIIVEGNFEQVCFTEVEDTLIHPDHHHPQITPQFIAKRIADLTFLNVSVLFCGNSQYAAGMALAILRARHYEIIGQTISQGRARSIPSSAVR